MKQVEEKEEKRKSQQRQRKDSSQKSSLLNVEDISELLGVKVATIYGWVSEGYIPHIKLGRLVRFNLDAVFEWVASKEVQGRNSRVLHKDFLSLG